ncbi:uncharacterized protein [Porites lutea]|uniref:uncharacterized protein n=1 Tax=Porites lutea TaxID=51062 RepID=UPI003CC6D310
MAAAPLSLEGLFAYISERFAAGVIQSYQGQVLLEDAPLLQRKDPLEDFKKFNRNDEIFQEYDPPSGDDSKMGWKRSRPPTWRLSLWKAMEHAFCIQILGGVALGSLAIVILVLDINTVDLCYDMKSKNWTTIPKRIQAVMVTADTTEAFFVELWTFLVVLTMFGWRLIKEFNLLFLNLLGPCFDTCYRLYLQVYGIYDNPWRTVPANVLFLLLLLMNSLIIGRDIAKKSETERNKRIKKAIKVAAMLVAQFAFGIPITYGFVYVLIPLYGEVSETYRAIITGALPLVTAIPKVIVRLAAQRIDFLHVLHSASAIVFRVMQAELTSLRLFILLSFAHGAIDLVERLTIVIRDYAWYFIYKKLKRDSKETILRANQFRSPRSMRFVADMSIQMILFESTSLIAAVGFIQLYKFMYNRSDTSSASTNMVFITQFFIRVSIAISIDFVFNSFSIWLQMAYLNIAVVRVWRKKWRKHMLVAFILTALTLCYFISDLFAVVEAKNTSGVIKDDISCRGPFSKF